MGGVEGRRRKVKREYVKEKARKVIAMKKMSSWSVEEQFQDSVQRVRSWPFHPFLGGAMPTEMALTWSLVGPMPWRPQQLDSIWISLLATFGSLVVWLSTLNHDS
ncbi:unnamed protein product [Linum trigynum]|uniref:Uncharacterized protein n=1 Tax=Linum trigynum TaxID=586398 RepID=A0AAV2GHL4_9ROSI